MEIEVTNPEFTIVSDVDKTEFKIMNMKTQETWPISKAGMLFLAQNLDGWFKEMAASDE